MSRLGRYTCLLGNRKYNIESLTSDSLWLNEHQWSIYYNIDYELKYRLPYVLKRLISAGEPSWTCKDYNIINTLPGWYSFGFDKTVKKVTKVASGVVLISKPN